MNCRRKYRLYLMISLKGFVGRMSEELKACSLEAAQKWVEKELDDYFTDNEYLVGSEIDAVEALMRIKNELNCRTEPENKPLTAEQLRKMDRKPVWVKDLIYPELSRWIVVGGIEKHELFATSGGMFPFNSYGKTWLAYAGEPDE